MAGNMHKWASRHRKTEKSGHREAAKTIPYPRRRCCGMISENQEAIWGMSDIYFLYRYECFSNFDGDLVSCAGRVPDILIRN